MKVLSMYLPQFHRIPENDKWWGNGFTEWTAVKKAKNLFSGHEQPHIPLNHNYYNLLNKDVMVHQAELMERYSLDGQCFYHYYFKDGRRILEKPAENLLQWKDIDMPFCFCWANESWIRSWVFYSGEKGNPWFDIFDEEVDRSVDNDGILIQQQYGNIKAWTEHFYYLLPFFNDPRYIKQDGKPVFVILKPDDIKCLDEMLELWRKLAKEEGFAGLYIVGAYTGDKGCMDSTLTMEPQDSINRFASSLLKENNTLFRYCDYEDVWKRVVYKYVKKGNCLGGFVGYDDTPRRGKSGTVVAGQNPDVFSKYFLKLLQKASFLNSQFIFINAWNEWGEGMHLEPDETYGFAFLEALKKARDMFDNEQIAEDGAFIVSHEEHLREENAIKRHRGYWKIMDNLLDIRERGVSIKEYLDSNNYNKIAIYGLGMIGKHIVALFEEQGIHIVYGLDKNHKSFRFPVLSTEEELPETDLIICTVFYEFDEIKKMLSKKTSATVCSLSDLLEDCMG